MTRFSYHSKHTINRKVEDGKLHVVRNITHIKARKLVNAIYLNFLDLSDYPELKHNRHELMRLVTSEKSKVILIMVDGKIAAYLIGEIMDLDDGRRVFYISYLFTSKIFRGKGFASRLMRYADELVKNFEFDGIMLTCDTEDEEVHNFYLARGFFPDLILRNYKKHDVLYKGRF
jgi:GNAT superfamily N-acetyltransferase